MTMSEQIEQTLRIDKWLWFARFYKTRGIAGKAVDGGHVKINGVRAKPSPSRVIFPRPPRAAN